MPDLVAEVVDFIRGERLPILPETVAVELVLLGAVSELWSTAETHEWAKAIEQAVERGLIVRCGDKVQLAPPADEEIVVKPKQMGLMFE